MPPMTRKKSVIVPSRPANALFTEKLFWMSMSTNVRMVKSNASSVQAAKVVRNAFHCVAILRGTTGAVRVIAFQHVPRIVAPSV